MTATPSQRCSTASRPRRGASLVELLAVMGVNAVLLGIIIATIAAVNRSDRQFNQRFRAAEAPAPLLERLREDVHAAQVIRWDEDKSELHFETDDDADPTIVYALREQRWERRSSLPDNPAAESELTAVFSFPISSAPNVTPPRATVGELLHIHWPAAADAVGRRTAAMPIQLIAQVGRHSRLVNE